MLFCGQLGIFAAPRGLEPFDNVAVVRSEYLLHLPNEAAPSNLFSVEQHSVPGGRAGLQCFPHVSIAAEVAASLLEGCHLSLEGCQLGLQLDNRSLHLPFASPLV